MPIVFAKPASPVSPFLVQDTFTDTNGTLLSSHTPEIGGPWVIDGLDGIPTSSNASIQNNALVFSSNSTAGLIDMGVADVDITVLWTPAVGQQNRNSVILRYLDENNYIYLNIREDNGDMVLWRRETGTPTLLVDSLFSWSEGTQYTIRITANGSAYASYIDGSPILSTTETFQQTLTRHGLGRNAGSVSTEFDNFEAVAI